MLTHGDQALGRSTERLDLVVFASGETAERQDLFHLQRVGRVRRVHDECFAAEVRGGLDAGLGDQLILRTFAAHDDDDILVGEFNHGDGVVYGKVSDVTFSGGQVGAQFVGIFLVVVDDFEAVLGEEALLVRDDKLDWAPQQSEDVDLLRRGGLRARSATK